jgi:hypothetical protein
MRSVSLHWSSLIAALGVGAGAFYLAGARRRQRARAAEPWAKDRVVIDGATPPPRAAYEARPAPEANASSSSRLESEAEDFDPLSQRW